MLSSFSHSLLAQRPTLLLPHFSPIRVLNHHSTSFPLTRNFRPSHSTLEPSNKKWKILCFRREEFGYGDSKPEFTEDPIYEELAKPKLDESCGKTKDWVSSLQEVIGLIVLFPIGFKIVHLLPV
ncbi:hypothetical protein CsSME_00050553 [Camellia sinensis var. sinensis]